MVLKIDKGSDGEHTLLRLSGRLQSADLPQLTAEIGGTGSVVLDLEEVKLVDRDVVRFLGDCEANGTQLRCCSPYIREWILKEKANS